MYFRVPRRRRSCPDAAKKSEWAAVTSHHRRDDSSSVTHRAKEEVSCRETARHSRIGNADPSPRLPQKTLKNQKEAASSRNLRDGYCVMNGIVKMTSI